jgi:DNA repair exonuclease SbcCD ATPase subunit
MTPEPVSFLWAEIEGFRGFRDAQRIELASSVVVLTGPNGTGKTSFFDALQWLVIGSLSRLEPWRARRNTEHIANAFRAEAPAIVTVGLRVGEQEVEVQRRGRHDGGVLTWTDPEGVFRGEDAQRRLAAALLPIGGDQSQLKRLLMTSALLEQDVVRAVLEDKPGNRYQHLESLLGLTDVRSFEVAARKRADRLAEAGRVAREEAAKLEASQHRSRDRANALRAQQATAPDAQQARSELAKRLRPFESVMEVLGELPATAADALLLQTNSAELADRLEQFERRLMVIVEHAAALPAEGEDDLESRVSVARDAALAAAEARSVRDEAEAAYEAASHRSESLAALAQAALPLLGERCPVCEQEIVREDVDRHLRELIKRGGAELPTLDAARQAARAAFTQAEGREQRADSQVAAVRTQVEQRQRTEIERSQLAEEVRAAVNWARDAGVELLLGTKLEALEGSAFSSSIEALRALSRAMADLSTVLRALPTGDEIAAAEGELRRLQPLAVEARQRASEASAREEEARTLQRASTRAAAAVADIRFRDLAPLIGDIFSRLDPHPVFKALDFALGVYRERGEARPIVRDIGETVEAEPLIVFSSSQANVAALTYFLALGWAAGADAMPFVLLDDPLQSLDDVNALGFADLCRHIRQQRQLIVSTHDRRLASLLERKLAPRTDGETTRLVTFTSWTRQGPEIEQRLVEQQLKEGAERRFVIAA